MHAQESTVVPKKILHAHRVDESIRIDGKFDEIAWSTSAVADDFVELQPSPGTQPEQPTEVRLLYSDDAIYIAAKMIEPDE